MKSRLLFFGVIGTALLLALAGMLRDANRTHALMPDPLQPFDPHEIGGISTTQLGQQVLNHTVTEIDRGKRLALPWIYTPTGWGLDVDKEVPDGADIGDVTSQLDALCNSTGPGDIDILAQASPPPPPFTPYDWYERTTIVQGTAEDYLLPMMPPYSWLLRQRADINNIWLGGTLPLGIDEVLNTVYTNVPWSPNQGTYVATTMLGGNPLKPAPAGAVCLDSPQNSNSITTVYHTPPLEGDSDGPCDTGLYQCADAGIYGMWTEGEVSLAAGSFIELDVEKHKVNNGPEDGLFYEWWEAEVVTPPAVPPTVLEASWLPPGAPSPVGPTYGEEVLLPKSIDVEQHMGLRLTCALPGHYLVVLKNILWPVPAMPGGTKDTYPDDNAFTFVVQVTCVDPMTPPPELPEVDKEVIWIRPAGVHDLNPPTPDLVSTPRHLQLVQGQSIAVTLDELKANHETEAVLGYEWLVAEVPDVWDKTDIDPVPGHDGIGDISVAWSGLPPGFGPCPAPSGDACISGLVDEPPGQTDVIADLTIDCPVDTPPGLYSVVVKAIDAPILDPLTLLPDSKASDNAGRTVIKVWCWPPGTLPQDIGDGTEDGSGLYPRWTAFENSDPLGRGDSRKVFTSPPSIRSDTNFVERVVDLQCYWLDANGCATCDGDGNGYITPQESWNDPDLLALGGKDVVDNDGDCLIDPAFAQPSHPVDEAPVLSGDLCPELPYSGVPNAIQYDRATDEDCDGLVDGIEKAWGSNPLLADSDGDGATDFEEMFQFSNPLNPDTDGDGLLDKPEDDYAAAPAGGAANSVPEARIAGNCADSVDNDTDGRTDAADPGCDPTDSDSDGASDADERALDSDPYNNKCDGADSDGDTVIDDGCPGGPPASGNPEASTPEAQIAGTCADSIDNDLDGKKDAADSGCGTADNDSDGKTDFDEVGLGSISRDEASAVGLEPADSDDNCPAVYNPDQANNGGRGRANGPFLAGGVSSNPAADTMGDACDQDDDNDAANDVAELMAPATDPYVADTDGDRCLDGVEGYLGTDPTSSASKCPATLAESQQKYFRACRWNLPPNGYDGGIWDAEYDGTDDDTELDPDGDGILCPRTTTGDKDADNGASAAANSCSPPPCSEIEDTVEIKGYNTFASQPDSDGDGCEDWIEIVDVNGDRAANALDRTLVLRRAFGLTLADPVSDAIFDVNKDGSVSALDGSLVGNNSNLKKSPFSCPLTSDLHRPLS